MRRIAALALLVALLPLAVEGWALKPATGTSQRRTPGPARQRWSTKLYELAEHAAISTVAPSGVGLNTPSNANTGVPSLDAWKLIMQNGVEALSTNSSPPLLGLPEYGQAELGMTDLFEVLDDRDLAAIDRYWEKLRPQVGYMPKAKRKKVSLALKVAYVAHRGQNRRSGEAFVTHPVAVAHILAQLKMDCEAVCAGLLHDTVEDTSLTFTQVEAFFGRQVRCIVEGETKVSKLPKIAMGSSHADEQAENLRMLFIAMTEDYRIIIVKLADRLHNMRTLKYMSPAKQMQISRETLEIFAPLAHRLGIWQIKSELEDIAFMYLYPREYRNLEKRLKERESRYQKALKHSREELEQKIADDKMLSEQGVNATVTGRMKELYSLWLKLETKYERKLDRIHDVVALRVIIDAPPRPGESEIEAKTRGTWLCYHVLGLVQHLPGCQPVPSQVKDYISFPKPNGYQSLHTCLVHDGQVVEVQIRTSWMHTIALYGMASHATYKEQQLKKATDGSAAVPERSRQYTFPWFASIAEWHSEVKNSREFVTAIRRELLGERVFVFLRDGKILNLSRGATVIDAAFQIHTEVGLTMVGATINGQTASLSYELKNGDVVSIQTDPIAGRPSPDWLRHAQSRTARARLRTYFRTQQRESLVDAGRLILNDWLRRYSGLVVEHLGYIPDETKLAKAIRTRTPDADIEEFCMHLAHSPEEDVLLMMAKVLHLNPELIANYQPHQYWSQRRRTEAVVDIVTSDGTISSSSSNSVLDSAASDALSFSNEPYRERGALNGAAAPARRTQWGPGVGFLSGSGPVRLERRNLKRVTMPVAQQQAIDAAAASGEAAALEAANAAAAAAAVAAGFPGLIAALPLDGAPLVNATGMGAMVTANERFGSEKLSGAGMRPPRALRASPRQLNGNSEYAQAAAAGSGALRSAGVHDLSDALEEEEGLGGLNGGVKHYADAEMLCTHCMPVRGDDIVGTREPSGETTVHRRGCPEQELQILDYRRNYRAIAKRRRGGGSVIAGVARRGGEKVPLEWTPWEESEALYRVEIAVYCADRKFLLSDVSNVVSSCSTIQSTASRTLGRDATLSYCVLVRDLDHLQKLIDQVMQVESVMTCERVFGSEGQ